MPLYSVTFAPTSEAVQVDLFELIPGSVFGLSIVGLILSQNTDFGDAQDELLSYAIKRGQTTSGSGGTAAITPNIVRDGDAAAGFTAETLNTTKATSGTIVTLHQDAFNVRGGLQLWFPPECRPSVRPSGRMTVELTSTPADAIFLTGTVYVLEGTG